MSKKKNESIIDYIKTLFYNKIFLVSRSALRMRPNRIIVGEVRGAEAIDMLQALNTGHLGFPSCLHYLYQRNHSFSVA